jgi:hypothetical protein
MLKNLLIATVLLSILIPPFGVNATSSEGCVFLGEEELEIGWIQGPAIISPYGDDDFALAVLPGASYYNLIEDGVMYSYEGDLDCLRRQYEYVEKGEIIEIEIDRSPFPGGSCTFLGGDDFYGPGWVTGPSIIEIYGENKILLVLGDYFVPLPIVGLWEYQGDIGCLRGQATEFFPGRNIVEIFPQPHLLFLPFVQKN